MVKNSGHNFTHGFLVSLKFDMRSIFFSGILYCLSSVFAFLLTKETASEIVEAGMTLGRVGRCNYVERETEITKFKLYVVNSKFRYPIFMSWRRTCTPAVY